MKKIKNVSIVIFKILITLTFIGGIAVAGYSYLGYNNVKKTVQHSYKKTTAKKLRNVNDSIENGQPISILLMGVDTGDLDRTYKGRTDSIILLTVNPKEKKTTIVSIPRDSVVSIIGYENTYPQKINAAYEYGNATASINTVQTWLNVPIDFYATINMNGMKQIIDKLGGIDITPTLSFDYEGASFKEGVKQHLNGFQALKYSRMRYDDPQGDYGRQARQRQVISALIKKAKNVSSLLNQSLLSSISTNLSTDLNSNDLLTMAQKYIDVTDNVSSDHLQGNEKVIDGVSYEEVSQDEKQRITNLIRKNLDISEATTGPLHAGTVSGE